jgi:hypothetical protein
MLKITNNTALMKGVLIAVLFHVIIGIALISNSGRKENLVAQRKPEVVTTHNKVAPRATAPKTHDNHQIHEGLRTFHIYSWLDSDGVKHYSNSVPPPGARNVQFRKESKSGTMSDRAPIVGNKPAFSAANESAAYIQGESTSSSHYERVSEDLIQHERERLEALLEIYEQRYWRRKKTIISLEEKERLRRPITRMKEKLKELEQSPDRYFGFKLDKLE